MGKEGKVITNLRRRLDALALDQLRAEVVMLRERLDLAESRADRAEAEAAKAWDCVDEWINDYYAAQLEICDLLGAKPGLTKDGKLVPIKGVQP